MSKVIQLAVTNETDKLYSTVYALCENGTLWLTESWNGLEANWLQVNTPYSIPPPKQED
jgi:hypothetical protein